MIRTLNLMRRLSRDERGVIAIVFAVMFPVVAGILALGIETGIWYGVKRHNQSIADVAAYSGALEIASATGGDPAVAAKADALLNGFNFVDPANTASTVDVGSTTVTVTLRHDQTPLMVKSFLGSATFPIVTRAVASVQSQASCASSTGGSGIGLAISGTATVEMPGCTITSNSTSSASISLSGNSTIDAWSVYTAGGISGRGNADLNLSVPATTGGTKLTDPYCKSSTDCVKVPTSVTTFSMPAAATTIPTDLPTVLAAPSAQAANPPPAPSFRTAANCNAGQTSPSSAISSNLGNTQCYTSGSPIVLSNTITTNNNNTYYFASSVTVNGSLTVTKGATLYIAGSLTVNGTLILDNNCGHSNNTTIGIQAAGGIFSASSGSTVTGVGGVCQGGQGLSDYYLQANDFSFGGNLRLGSGANYQFISNGGTANVGLNGCTTFLNGTTTLNVANGSLTTGAGSSIYFNPNGTFCGATNTPATSIFALTVANGNSFTLGAGSGDTIRFGPASYGFNGGGLTINGAALFQSGTTNISIPNGTVTTATTSTLNFCGSSTASPCLGTSSNYALSTNASYSLTGATIFGDAKYAFYGGSLTVAPTSGTVSMGVGSYYVDTGNLAFQGPTTFTAPSSGSPTSIIVKSGNLTNSATGSLTFNGITGSQYNICFGGTQTQGGNTGCGSSSGNGISLSGPVTFNSATYFILNGSTNDNNLSTQGLTLNSGSSATFASGIYSVQNGFFTINNGASATLAAGSFCGPNGIPSGGAAGSCFYTGKGGVTNSGTMNFGSGNFYIQDGSTNANSSGFANLGTLSFTGGSSSNYHFFNGPAYGTGNSQNCSSGSGGGNPVYGALSLRAGSTANFGPANYYAVNGALCMNVSSGTAPTLTCTGCTPGGAGVTFILTGSMSDGSSYASKVGTLQIPGPITATLNAPNGTPDHTACTFTTEGCYKGILFFQDADYSGGPNTAQTPLGSVNGSSCSNNSNCSFLQGGVNMALTGAAYVPQSVVKFESNNQTTSCIVIIAEAIIFSGNSALSGANCAAYGVATVTSSSVALTL